MTIHGIMQLRHGGVSRGPRLGYLGAGGSINWD